MEYKINNMPIVKNSTFFVGLVLSLGLLLVSTTKANAAIPDCGTSEFSYAYGSGGDLGKNIIAGSQDTISFNFTKNQMPAGDYRIMAYSRWNNGGASEPYEFSIPTGDMTNTTDFVTLQKNSNNWLTEIQVGAGSRERVRNIYLEVWCGLASGCHSTLDHMGWDRACLIGSYTLTRNNVNQCSPQLTLSQQRVQSDPNAAPQTCYNNGCIDGRSQIFLEPSTVTNSATGKPYQGNIDVYVNYGSVIKVVDSFSTDANGVTPRLDMSAWLQPGKSYEVIFAPTWFDDNCSTSITVSGSCADRCAETAVGPAEQVNFELCAQVSEKNSSVPDKTQKQQCIECFDKDSIWTAVGCISTEPQKIIEAVIKIGVGMGGGIALLVTLIGGFLITTSQGEPKRTQQGKEMITAAVIGILFVLFSVVILQFIGVTIFRLPGFGT